MVRKLFLRMIALFCCFSLLLSCVRFPYPPAPFVSAKRHALSQRQEPLWLVAGSLHSDFVVRTQWLVRHGCRLPDSLKSFKYVVFGWGDRVAYTNRWGMKDVPHALFWESESIVQVVGFSSKVVPTFPKQEVLKVLVPEVKGGALAHFLNHSFKYQEGNPSRPLALRPSRWGHGYFIASPYSYYLPRMCNQWVSTALMEAGVSTTRPSATMSSQTLIKHVRQYNSRE